MAKGDRGEASPVERGEAVKERKKGRQSDAHVADGHGCQTALNLFGNNTGADTYDKRAGQYAESGFGKSPKNKRIGAIGRDKDLV